MASTLCALEARQRHSSLPKHREGGLAGNTSLAGVNLQHEKWYFSPSVGETQFELALQGLLSSKSPNIYIYVQWKGMFYLKPWRMPSLIWVVYHFRVWGWEGFERHRTLIYQELILLVGNFDISMTATWWVIPWCFPLTQTFPQRPHPSLQAWDPTAGPLGAAAGEAMKMQSPVASTGT